MSCDMACPSWCREHYVAGERGEQTIHAGFPLSVHVAESYSGDHRDLGLWLERRANRETGEIETVGTIEVGIIAEDVDLTPD